MKVSFSLAKSKAKGPTPCASTSTSASTSKTTAAPKKIIPPPAFALDDDDDVDTAAIGGGDDVGLGMCIRGPDGQPQKKKAKLKKLDDPDPDPLSTSVPISSLLLPSSNSTSNYSTDPTQTDSPKPRLSKTALKRMAEEEKVDKTVYQYDEIWERMQVVKQRQKEVKAAEARERKPKYIAGLLQSATQRKLDYVRAEEKMIQREREAEGDEFKEKDQFITQAYKDQMEEVRRAEEEEKKREAAEKAKKPSTGLAYLYAQMLTKSEEQHNETMAATEALSLEPSPSTADQAKSQPKVYGPNLTITKPQLPAPPPPPTTTAGVVGPTTKISDAEVARLAKEEGKDVELNDDGQIVDHRELLSAGLNLAMPNTRRLGIAGFASSSSSSTPGLGGGDKAPVITHRAVGTAASRREIDERRRKEVEQQLHQEALAKARREEEEEAAKMKAVPKRNKEGDVVSARQRYLERKQQRSETL